MFPVCFPARPDLFILEPTGSILLCLLKENPEHIHVQCFAESARSCEQRYLGKRVDKIPDQERLIYIIVVRYRLNIAGYADGERQQGSGCFQSLSDRLLHVFRQDPGTALFHGPRYFAGLAHLLYSPDRDIPFPGGFICGYIKHDAPPLSCVLTNYFAKYRIIFREIKQY